MDRERRAALAEFRDEVEDRVTAIRQAVADLDAEPDAVAPEPLHALFRHFHSLKGAANLLGLAPIEQLAHATEDLLALARQQGVPPGAPLAACLRYVCNRLAQLGDHLERLRAIDLSADLARLDQFARRYWSPAP